MTSPWINYSHPGERSAALNKSKVASYIGKYHRNRSKPGSRPRQGLRSIVEPRDSESHAIHGSFQILQWDSKHGTRQHGKKGETSPQTPESDQNAVARETGPRGIPRMSTVTVPLTSMQQAILRFFEQNVLQAIFRDELVIGFGTKVAGHRRYPAVQQVLQYALDDELQLHAVLASAASRMVHILSNNSAYRAQALRSTILAISKVRAATSSQYNCADYDPKLAHAILELCITAFYQDDLAAAQLHLRAVKFLLDNTLQQDQLSAFVMEVARLFDVFIAVDAGDSPIFPLDWEPSDAASPFGSNVSPQREVSMHILDEQSVEDSEAFHTTEELLSEAGHRIPIWETAHIYPLPFRTSSEPARYPFPSPQEGFSEALKLGVLSECVSKVITKHNLLSAQIVEIIVSNDSLNPSLPWINVKGMAILHRFCSLSKSLVSELPPATHVLDIPALIALQIQNSVCHSPLFTRTMRRLVVRLHNSLQSWMASNWLEENGDSYFVKLLASSPNNVRSSCCETLFWIMFTGLYVSYSTPWYERWFRTKALFLLEQLGIQSFAAVASLVARFTNSSHPLLVHGLVRALSENKHLDGEETPQDAGMNERKKM